MGWTLAFVVTGAVALWELDTGRHLDTNQAVVQSSIHVVASTFYNPNNYAGFLLACLPFLIWNAIVARAAWSRYLHIALVAGWWVLIAATQSRTGIVGAVVAAPLLVYWLIRSAMLRRRQIALPLMLLAFGVVAGLSFLPLAALGQQALTDLQSQFTPGDGISASDQARLNLTMLGWRMFLDSWMLGHGAGAFASNASYWGGLELYGLTNAHNGIVEIAAEYGLPLLLPLVAVIFAVARAAIARHPAATRADLLDFRMVAVLGLSAVVASNLVASSILLSPWWWLLLGQLAAQAWLLPRQWIDAERTRAEAVNGRGRHRIRTGGGPPDPRRPFADARVAGY
nr:O-antigen ligase family protein [Micromonospora terminaliae]